MNRADDDPVDVPVQLDARTMALKAEEEKKRKEQKAIEDREAAKQVSDLFGGETIPSSKKGGGGGGSSFDSQIESLKFKTVKDHEEFANICLDKLWEYDQGPKMREAFLKVCFEVLVEEISPEKAVLYTRMLQSKLPQQTGMNKKATEVINQKKLLESMGDDYGEAEEYDEYDNGEYDDLYDR